MPASLGTMVDISLKQSQSVSKYKSENLILKVIKKRSAQKLARGGTSFYLCPFLAENNKRKLIILTLYSKSKGFSLKSNKPELSFLSFRVKRGPSSCNFAFSPS